MQGGCKCTSAAAPYHVPHGRRRTPAQPTGWTCPACVEAHAGNTHACLRGPCGPSHRFLPGSGGWGVGPLPRARFGRRPGLIGPAFASLSALALVSAIGGVIRPGRCGRRAAVCVREPVTRGASSAANDWRPSKRDCCYYNSSFARSTHPKRPRSCPDDPYCIKRPRAPCSDPAHPSRHACRFRHAEVRGAPARASCPNGPRKLIPTTV